MGVDTLQEYVHLLKLKLGGELQPIRTASSPLPKLYQPGLDQDSSLLQARPPIAVFPLSASETLLIDIRSNFFSNSQL